MVCSTSTDPLVGGVGVFALAGSAAIAQLLFRRTQPWSGTAAGSVALATGMALAVVARDLGRRPGHPAGPAADVRDLRQRHRRARADAQAVASTPRPRSEDLHESALTAQNRTAITQFWRSWQRRRVAGNIH